MTSLTQKLEALEDQTLHQQIASLGQELRTKEAQLSARYRLAQVIQHFIILNKNFNKGCNIFL